MKRNDMCNDCSTQCQIESPLNDEQYIKIDNPNNELINFYHLKRNSSERIKMKTLNIVNYNLTSGLKLFNNDTPRTYYNFATKRKMLTSYNNKNKQRIEKKASCPIINQLNNRDPIHAIKEHEFIPHKTVKGNTHCVSIQSQLIKEKLRLRNKKPPFSFHSTFADRGIYEKDLKIYSRNQFNLNFTSKQITHRESFWRKNISPFHRNNKCGK